MSEELIIDENNFKEHFFDTRWSKPQKGQVLARYTAIADFVDGHMKKDIIDLLFKDKAEAATKVMKKLGSAVDKDAIRVCKEIAQDLLELSPAEVEQKSYKYTVEFFYWTKKENVPLDDPHWSIISLHSPEEFLDQNNNKLKITAKELPHAED